MDFTTIERGLSYNNETTKYMNLLILRKTLNISRHLSVLLLRNIVSDHSKMFFFRYAKVMGPNATRIGTINYIDLFHSFRTQTKSHGELGFELLYTLRNDLNVDKTSIQTTLGGG